MNSKKDHEESIKSPSDVCNQPSFCKWLKEMSLSLEKNFMIQPKQPESYFGGHKENFSVNSSDIPSRLSDTNMRALSDTRKDVSEKYGRRSIVTQMYFENTPRNISLTSSDYLVPKFEHIDFSELKTKDPHQITLENSWKNLNAFRQSRKQTEHIFMKNFE